ncbi:carbonic anhydrase [Cellulomonas bogoriensis]|uniref:carbonic anhydrase n=1 Tax=Cellulomonas bogoriensis 69B4 = DSM 16987 TaxID=1386082 RepID=A0A0A0C148_9CELL|nr:carbonic anhydrase [Cellulomonas bogoriensis]KGM13905.1 carbonic anhydrase [Cellulomonas bogoriensis 69B4 = DSM 16987]
MPHVTTPAQAWAELLAGNERFVSGTMEHPSQNADRRAETRGAQHPFAVVFGCSDSRVAAEIIFDRGLGDLFVVRTAGHVVDTTVVGSIEYGVAVLGAPLVIVLGHDSCGAVAAAANALTTGEMPPGFVRAVVDRVIPSVVHLPDAGTDEGPAAGSRRRPMPPDPETLKRDHVRHTVRMLRGYSAVLESAITEGRCAIVGLEYALAEGRVRLVEHEGDLGQ